MNVSRPYENVFDALEDDPVVADNLRIRSEMMIRLRIYIDKERITQGEAAHGRVPILHKRPETR